jgi:hypothetical protein
MNLHAISDLMSREVRLGFGCDDPDFMPLCHEALRKSGHMTLKPPDLWRVVHEFEGNGIERQ